MPNASPNAIVHAGHDRREPVRRVFGENRRARHLGAIHDLHVVRAAVADDLQLLLLLQQRLPELPVAVGLALQDVVVAALAVEIHRLVLLLLELTRRSCAPGRPRCRSRSGPSRSPAPAGRSGVSRAFLICDIELLASPDGRAGIAPTGASAPRARSVSVVLGLDHSRVGRDDREIVGGVGGGIDAISAACRSPAFCMRSLRWRVTVSFSAFSRAIDDVLLRSPSDSALLIVRDTASSPLRASADLLFLLGDLVGQPAKVLLDVRQTQVEVLRGVLLGQRVGRERGELRIAVLVDDLARAASSSPARSARRRGTG